MHARRRERGLSLLEVTISAAILSTIFTMAISGYTGSVKGTMSGTAKLESMATSARALTAMNLELQEASVRDETVEIYLLDPDDGSVVPGPVSAAAVPPPGTIYPTAAAVGTNSYALRFMTVGDFVTVGDVITVEEDGPFMYRLGTGAPGDFPRDQLVRIDESGADRPRVLCRGVEQLVFQRDSRGGALLVTLVTRSRDSVTGQWLRTRQVLTITPKNDFSANLANFDLNGEEI